MTIDPSAPPSDALDRSSLTPAEIEDLLAATRRLEPAARELAQTQARLDEAQQQVLAAEQKAAKARALELERDDLKRQVTELDQRIRALQGSLTWRSTAPLRRVVAKGKRIAQDQLQDTALDTLRRWRGY